MSIDWKTVKQYDDITYMNGVICIWLDGREVGVLELGDLLKEKGYKFKEV